jgi:hypothetical protein
MKVLGGGGHSGHRHLGEGTWPFPTNGQDFAVIGGRSRS